MRPFTRPLALAVAVACAAALLEAQSVPDKGGPVSIHTLSVVITADQQELLNTDTQERRLSGNVKIRPAERPIVQTVAAKNRAGVPFPAARPVRATLRGGFEMVIDELLIRADEADINVSTGDMDLRGNVRVVPASRVR